MIVTNNPEIARLCRSMRNQGRGEMGSWLEHERLGYKYRMTELSAALGVSQLKRIEKLLAKRERVGKMYRHGRSCHSGDHDWGTECYWGAGGGHPRYSASCDRGRDPG